MSDNSERTGPPTSNNRTTEKVDKQRLSMDLQDLWFVLTNSPERLSLPFASRVIAKAVEYVSGDSSAPETPTRPKCEDCKHEIDPDWCWCGDAIEDHKGMSHNHSPVRMGCTCGMRLPPLTEETSASLNHAASCGAHDGKTCDCGKSPQKASAPHEHVWSEMTTGGAQCTQCRIVAQDWFCPDSPDHLCHYDKGNMDQCDFCGLPEERK